ncbi:hypothetical protein PoB_002390300 [Plakobranchus ocellatus]|uniref:DUF19 domain-containing protein n=1 Tax=Plakobranchus ocellatus TaxID=259542 RepID=A0AAV3ZRC2_9GAST|nr:hypothetical protein PoB_002390300 [Plakobranchus ocellatus]
MRNQFSVSLALTTCMLLGFFCESSGQSCADLRRCAKRVSRTNFFFTYIKFTLAQFLSEIDRVCVNADLRCWRDTHTCTNVTVVNNFQLVRKVREFLCSEEGRGEAKNIIQEDKCVGNWSDIHSLKRKHSRCISTHVGSMSGVNCT